MLGGSGGGHYFLKALEKKADETSLNVLNERKTNKEDSAMQMRCIDIMQKQLREFAVLFVELVKHGVKSK